MNCCEYDNRCAACTMKQKKRCPNCGTGKHGKDPLCDDCWKTYLGTHIGGRADYEQTGGEDSET